MNVAKQTEYEKGRSGASFENSRTDNYREADLFNNERGVDNRDGRWHTDFI